VIGVTVPDRGGSLRIAAVLLFLHIFKAITRIKQFASLLFSVVNFPFSPFQ